MWENFFSFLLKPITGIIHVGAHTLEEKKDYLNLFGLQCSDILWIEALLNKVEFSKQLYPGVLIENALVILINY